LAVLQKEKEKSPDKLLNEKMYLLRLYFEVNRHNKIIAILRQPVLDKMCFADKLTAEYCYILPIAVTEAIDTLI
jgi:hypothetical protein